MNRLISRTHFGLALLLASLVALSSCAGVKIVDNSPKVRLKVEASADLNPDNAGRPSPVVVRIYELKSPHSFDTADFFALYDDDKQILGGDILSVEEREVFPGETFEIKRKLNKEATSLAFMAAYRDIDRSRWRLSLDTPAGKKTKGRVTLGANALEYAKK